MSPQYALLGGDGTRNGSRGPGEWGENGFLINYVGVDHRVKRAVSVVEYSANRKLGGVSATYAAQVTCPGSCPLRGAGCYAEHGKMGITTLQRNGHGDALDPLDVLKEEARRITALPARGGLLRVHVVGDVFNTAGAAIIGAAMRGYDLRGGVSWTYTHAWRDIPRETWGPVNVLASCETPADVLTAQAAGYAAALIVSEHSGARAYTHAAGFRVLPCVEETAGRTCRECGICMREPYLRDSGTVIAFAAHGTRRGTVKRVIAGGL